MTRTKASLAEFRPSSGGSVLLHPAHAEFAYSDGQEVEQRVLQILKTTGDLSVGSPDLLAQVRDWPTEYHFTDTRANLLRHLPLRRGVRVLELGAGCGAVTRFLGEAGCTVSAVEGSLLRAECARERTRDLDTVSVYCANFGDIAFRREFDVVTLIGVLEYAPMFFPGDDPMGACLSVALSALAPGGMLVVAIENQLGLKYFAGATEDHLGTHFSGVEGRYSPVGVRTLGRRQLERALTDAGFGSVEFQYPFPDYKLPSAVVFEAGLRQEGFRPSEIVRHLYARDYAGKDLRSIDTAQVWPVLESNGLLGDLANSFLVLAREDRDAAPAGADAAGELLALAYSTGRARSFQTRTAFRAQAHGRIWCEKSLVYPEAAQQPAPAALRHRLIREAYIGGTTLHSAIASALRSGDRPRVMELLRGWLEFLNASVPQATMAVWDRRVPGELWDCTPGNLVETDGTLRSFDEEWVSEPGPTIRHLLLRYVFGLAFSAGTAPWFESCFQAPGGLAVRRVIDDLGMPFDEETLEQFAGECNETNALVFPLKPPIVLDPTHFFGEHGAGRTAQHERSAPWDFLLNALRRISRLPTR